jgi:enoyl-CoA hydratase/carnithine racemase
VAEVATDSDAEAIAIAEKIAAQPPTAIINTKALMKASKHDAVEAVMRAEFQLFAMALESEEFADAAMLFMAKKGK